MDIVNKLTTPIRVILADDDKDDREIFDEIVTGINSDIQLEVAEDGLQLMNILNGQNQHLPNIIFLDLNMPGKKGKECLKEIKNDQRLKDIPVIIYSTSSYTKDITDTHLSGAHLYICKPNTFSRLEYILKKIFELDFKKLAPSPPIKNFVISENNI